MTRAIFCWSGGKDSAMALHKVMQEKEFEVVSLLTTVNKNFGRIVMHGVREELLDKQANSIGIPLLKIYIEDGTNAEYETKMKSALEQFKQKGIEHVIFGDIFLEDLRAYREKNLEKTGMKAVFPLWKIPTDQLIYDFIQTGFKTITCCVDEKHLGKEFAGKIIDGDFVYSLPKTVDPCGENGEFHTFAFDGPVFKKKISFSKGEIVRKTYSSKNADGTIAEYGFWYCDLINDPDP